MAEDVERVVIKRSEGSPDRSGPYTIVGIVLGVLLVAGVAAAVIGIPEIEQWWGSSGTEQSTTVTETTAP